MKRKNSSIGVARIADIFLSKQVANSCSAIRSISLANLVTVLYQAMRGSRHRLLEEPLERHRDWARVLALFVAYQKELFLDLKFNLANFPSPS
jgi:hypothetical protein